MLFDRQTSKKKNLFRSLPSLEFLEARLVPAGEFSLHSLPGASKRIFLDFDGHTTSNTGWLSGATIVSPAYDIDNNSSSFSNTELANIRDIWERVTEDYQPFNVDVTTEDPGIEALRNTGGSDAEWGIRVVISNNISPAPSAGGVAFLNSFSWNTDTPCFVFPINLSNVNKYIADAASHEVGHTLNLNHDGDSSQGYYPGHGTGVTSWGPIMGAPYSVSLTQWSKGEYSGANNTEDDLAIITNSTNGFGYRNDDYGSSISTASNLTIQNSTTINTTGIIERNTDQDFFRFILSVGGTVNINIDPATKGPNLDIEAKLYNSSGTVLSTSNPTGALNASFNTTLSAGTYYISIDGVGEGNVLGTGYSDYGSLGFYSITGTVPNSITPPAITGPSGGPGAQNSAKSIPENTTDVHTFTADKTVTWSLNGGSDQAKFTINPFTGNLSFVSPPDFENPGDSDRNNTYIVVVRATDPFGNATSQTVTVTVTDVLELPPKITGPSGVAGAATSSKNLNENITDVCNFSADKVVTWSLTGGTDLSRFTIDPVTGKLSFNITPDFELPADSDRNNTYVVVVRAMDSSGLFSTQTTTITILDVLEAGTGTNRPDVTGSKIMAVTPTTSGSTITGFRVKFNEAIQTATFTTSDVTLLAPNGNPVSLTGVSVAAVANTGNSEFTILGNVFSTLNTAGAYTLTIGPDILDLAGNKMNQDGDALNGELVQDQFSGTFSFLTSYVFANNTTAAIKDFSKVTSTFTINQNMNIKDVNVLLNISHTSRSDLLITLRSPSGQISTLSNRRGGWGDDFTNTIFDDAAGSTISSLTAAASSTGTYQPDTLLNVFNNQNAKGVWTLTIEDKAGGDIGKLNSWKLNIVTDTKLPTTTNLVSSSNGLISTTVNPIALAGMPLPSSGNANPSVGNPANPNVSPCGCPACRGLPTPNSPLIANAAPAGNALAAPAVTPASHQNQADALFGTGGNLLTLFRL